LGKDGKVIERGAWDEASDSKEQARLSEGRSQASVDA